MLLKLAVKDIGGTESGMSWAFVPSCKEMPRRLPRVGVASVKSD